MNGLLKSVFLFIACITAGAAFSQEPYPSRPTRILVGFQAGGSVDLTARLIATHLAPLLGTPVLVENKLGASGIIAAGEVARSAPDGYTLFMANLGSSALAPNMQPTLPFDPVNDFTAVGQIAAVSYLAVIPASIPPNNLKEFIAWVKQRGDVPYASAGVGATGHMNGELLNQVAGLTMRHVPYKGAPQALTELMGDRPFSTSTRTRCSSRTSRRASSRRSTSRAPRVTRSCPTSPRFVSSDIRIWRLRAGKAWWGRKACPTPSSRDSMATFARCLPCRRCATGWRHRVSR